MSNVRESNRLEHVIVTNDVGLLTDSAVQDIT